MLSKSWDVKTQTPHGGQEWKEMSNFKEDFSVTTNALGPPSTAVAAAQEKIAELCHYPASDFEPALSDLSNFILGSDFTKIDRLNFDDVHSRLILGNGASELIDLVIGNCPLQYYTTGPFYTQYMEYRRSCVNKGFEFIRETCLRDAISRNEDSRVILDSLTHPTKPSAKGIDIDDPTAASTVALTFDDTPPSTPSQNAYIRPRRTTNPGINHFVSAYVNTDSAESVPEVNEESGSLGVGYEPKLHCIVNPCNPTGDFLTLKEMKEYIENVVMDNSWVIVDESMQPWYGPNWRDQSLVSQREWVNEMLNSRGILIFVMHSWTKLFSCPGIRIGSVLCPDEGVCTILKKHQVPWSVNCCAIGFTSAAVADAEFMQNTWDKTVRWRKMTIDAVKNRMHKYPDIEEFTFEGHDWLSWIWINTKNEDIAERLTKNGLSRGYPIRWGKYGYDLPTYIRIAVRDEKYIFDFIETVFDF